MTTTDTYRMLRALVDELARCGMTDAVTSPGSRNTPIVLSLVADARIRAWSQLDERGGGFFALGAAKASGRPVAVTCTSGTAAANLLPAVVEAHWARVPLVVLTADRPAELRDVGAGQAIDQLKLYGDAVRWFCEVEPPPAADDVAMRWIRQLACRAYSTALADPPGPVHLNLPLREPLVLDAPLAPETEAPGRDDGRPWTRHAGPRPAAPADAPDVLALAPRTVIVAGGPDPGGGHGVRLAQAAAGLGLPLLADPLSGARRGPAAIAHYDLVLRDERLAAPLAPELVVRVGDLPTSKPLRAWLAALPGARQVAIERHATWQDPDGALDAIVEADPATALAAARPPAPADPDWLAVWRAADAAAAAAIDTTLGDALSEPAVARRLTDILPAAATLYVASSMPIRDVEEFAGVRDDPPRVLSNRGANGIDGTVAAAFGAAAVASADPATPPVVLLIGDVALAHDIGSLLSARRLGLALTIVIVNNDGGGIFHFLAVSGEGEPFEEHVATPHGLDFARAAALYGLGHVAVDDVAQLRDAVTGALASGTTSIVEIRTDRAANRALHARVADAVSRSAPAASPRA